MTTETVLLQSDQVLALIPQKPPMVMIDQLVSSDEKRSISKFEIKADNVFCKDNLFTEPGLIENVAQTAAIRAGYTGMQKAKAAGRVSGPVLGYIAAVRNCTIHKLPSIGVSIFTEIIVEHEVLSVSLIKGKISAGNEIFLECEMKIFQKDK